MRVALLLFPVINHQSGKQIHPHIPGLCLPKFPALVNCATILFSGLTAYACRSAFIFCSPTNV